MNKEKFLPKDQIIEETIGIFKHNVITASGRIGWFFGLFLGVCLLVFSIWLIVSNYGSMNRSDAESMGTVLIIMIIFGILLTGSGLVVVFSRSGITLDGFNFTPTKIELCSIFFPIINKRIHNPKYNIKKQWDITSSQLTITLRQSRNSDNFYFHSFYFGDHKLENLIALNEATNNSPENDLYLLIKGDYINLGLYSLGETLISHLTKIAENHYSLAYGILPEIVKCPIDNCRIEVELEEHERKERKFVCPDCNNLIDMNLQKSEELGGCKLKFEASKGGTLRAGILGGFIGSLIYSGISEFRQKRLKGKFKNGDNEGDKFTNDLLSLAENYKWSIEV